ncbi:hypothetical protein ACIOZM_02680 [Pseudomonas sp. NPDC087346]|uniref:hypothetical protein n=1 Tax=Pseudomonas sp. NPDC087346 TaxID=3364438 RepID=UPI00381A023C
MTSHTAKNGNDSTLNEPSLLREYLEYYKTLSNPGYGILVTGDWGSGKTYQVTEILDKDEIHYISLFGAQSTEEIYSAVYAKMHPMKSITKGIANSSNGAGAGPVNLGGLLSGIANAIIREQVDNDKILVFDDLERSKIDINDLLGVFNKYIEHHNCRVIVVAHDKKITDALKEIKEKVFGQTIPITPQTSKAFDSFTNAIKSPTTSATLTKLKPVILDIFDQSKTHSLRILRHSLEDLTRLFNALTNNHKSNEAAILELTSLFLALSLEIRAGRLDESSLKDRSGSIIRHRLKVSRKEKISKIPDIYTASMRYKNIDISNKILADDVLTSMLINGSYSETRIRECLNNSLYFTNPEDLPAWLVFMKFDELSDKESHDAAEKLKTQFTNREVIEPGEMLQLFSLRFLLSEMGLIPRSLSETEEDCREYMEDLLSQGRIKYIVDYRYNLPSYGGYSFWVEDSYNKNFSRLNNYLKDVQNRAEKQRFPEIAKTLLSLISSNGEEFAEKISYTNGGSNEFASIDILASILPSDFVQEWMGSPAKNWRHISRGLEQRYSDGKISTTLKKEKSWMKEVVSLIDREIIKSKGIRKKRIERILPLSLRNMI